jgi:hypothetical protein
MKNVTQHISLDLQLFSANNRKGFHCGGVLINNRYVVTGESNFLSLLSETLMTH